MFLKNTSEGNINLNSFEGYKFVVPAGVSAIWDKAGKEMLSKYGVIESPEMPRNKDKYGLDNGHGIPALSELGDEGREAWDKEGRRMAEVSRFQINFKLIPRASLIKTALKRGLPHERVTEFQVDQQIDIEEIANEINKLPIPDKIKYPENIETNENE